MRLERPAKPLGQEGDAFAQAFAFAHGDLFVTEVDIFDPKTQAFEQAQTAAIEEMGHEPIVALEPGEDGARFGTGKDHRDFRRSLGPLEIDELEFALEHMLIKEKQRAKSLVLGRGSDVSVDGQMIKEGGDLIFPHIAGVPLIVEENEAADPIEVRLLGADGVTFDAKMPADAVEQLR